MAASWRNRLFWQVRTSFPKTALRLPRVTWANTVRSRSRIVENASPSGGWFATVLLRVPPAMPAAVVQRWGSGVLNEQDVLEAVRRRVEDRGEALKLGLPDTTQITWRSLLEGTIVRCIESRTEEERLHYGHIDLSDRPEYDSLTRYPLAAPKDPARTRLVRLVKRGSVTELSCDCGNGKTACPRCQGRGDLPCETSMACAACRGIDSCLRCEGTGRRIRKAADERQPPDERVTCRQCGTQGTACSTCSGRGRTTCQTCQGTGKRGCPDCDRAGTVRHERCKGTGGTVRWTEGLIRREPLTEKIKQPKTGVPYLAWEAARESDGWHRAEATGMEGLTADLTGEFRDLVEPHLIPRQGEIDRQATFRYLRLARMTTPQHPHRVYYVFPTDTSPRVLVLPSQRRTWQITAVALGTLLILALLLRLFS